MELRLAFREILHNWRFSLAFASNLGLGLFGLVFLSAFHGSITDAFQSRSRALLTGDIGISVRRAFTDDELRAIRAVLEGAAVAESGAVELYSMVRKDDRSRLAELVAIEGTHPLYGQIELENAGRVDGRSEKPLVQAREVWVAPEFAVQMSLKRGDVISLGTAEFRVADFVKQDTGSAWRGFSLAPRIYLGRSHLTATGLIRPGSTVTHRLFFRTSPGADLDALVSQLNQALPDPGIRVVTHQTAGEQTARALAYLADFLGLVSLVGLFLASVGSAYLFQSFIVRRIGQVATLVSLGLSPARTSRVYLIQLVVLGFLAVGFAFAGALVALPGASAAAGHYLGLPLQCVPRLADLGLALLIGITGSVLACLPLLLQIRAVRPAILFQEGQEAAMQWNWRIVLHFMPVTLFFFGLSVWQAQSWRIGGAFFGGLLVSGLFLAGLAFGLLSLRLKVRALGPKLALRYLMRNRLSSSSAFLAVGLGALLINLLPQIQRNIESEIARPEVSTIPSLFLFDIQDEQIGAVEAAIGALGAGVSQISPLVRARLEAINGVPFEKSADTRGAVLTREEEQEARSRNRGYNLTYRPGLTEAETLVKGRPFSERLGEMPEVSVEIRFSERLGLKLGDVMRFDVQGVPVDGRIVSFRRVRWTSFQPNFFVQFQPGALEDAPKTFLATVSRTGFDERIRIQNEIVAKFPNVSIVDVTSMVQRMLGILEQMAWAMRAMALLAVITGLVVLFSIARNQVAARQREVQLLKVLGADSGQVRSVFWIEFGALGLLASSFGVLVSTGLSYGISRGFFDGAWDFSWMLPAATVAGVTALALGTAHLAIWRTLREKPAGLLAGEG